MKISMLNVYHCSPDYITSFDYSRGVHFGGLVSALTAGLRKANQIGEEYLYLHYCTLDDSKYTEVDDIGADWEFTFLAPLVYKYINKYEPDTISSWYIRNPDSVLLYKVIKLSINEAELMLDKYDLYSIFS